MLQLECLQPPIRFILATMVNTHHFEGGCRVHPSWRVACMRVHLSLFVIGVFGWSKTKNNHHSSRPWWLPQHTTIMPPPATMWWWLCVLFSVCVRVFNSKGLLEHLMAEDMKKTQPPPLVAAATHHRQPPLGCCVYVLY